MEVRIKLIRCQDETDQIGWKSNIRHHGIESVVELEGINIINDPDGFILVYSLMRNGYMLCSSTTNY